MMERFTRKKIHAELVNFTNLQDPNTAQYARCASPSMIITAFGSDSALGRKTTSGLSAFWAFIPSFVSICLILGYDRF